MTETIYSTRAYERSMNATVLQNNEEEKAVLLDRTVFYPGGGGQPPDTGALWVGDDRLTVTHHRQGRERRLALGRGWPATGWDGGQGRNRLG